MQELVAEDYDRRMEYCELMTERYLADNFTFFWTRFSDETGFSLNGNDNRHNMVYWLDENPFWMRDTNTPIPG